MKTTLKKIIPKKIAPKSSSAGAEQQEEVTEEAVEPNTEEAVETVEPPVEAEKPEEVSLPSVPAIPSARKGWVKVMCLREVTPPPMIGSFDTAKELGVTKLSPGVSYMFPLHVAHVLVDAKAVMLGV